ncbi:MAG: hypothetical protein RL094_710 [Candidatus Parcubacteria bacterium]|jgi:predicted enzyme related to lactoylglutathione lyase
MASYKFNTIFMFKDIAFTVYAVTDMPKARAFYEGVLGLTPTPPFDGSSEGAAWVEYGIGTATLSIGCSPDWKPSEDGASVGLETDTFDEVIEKIRAHKVEFKMEPMDFPTCKMAVVLDPDKNKIIIHHKKG